MAVIIFLTFTNDWQIKQDLGWVKPANERQTDYYKLVPQYKRDFVGAIYYRTQAKY
ncbi:MAG TPA: hypothetical protein VJP58_01880 [Candidatus Nitrosocosmicus sp.]|nr:hypothetical protein [Candidatus Nitrosocosmicus sp.]